MIYFFFFNDTATTEIYTLSLHDALPISSPTALSSLEKMSMRRHPPRRRPSTPPSELRDMAMRWAGDLFASPAEGAACREDRKSTRLNSSHANISYAVFCLKKKKLIAYHF